jgi:NAD(P)-dependent dehydrogenase (short-subunit alcohol dehydrogenase family)
VVSIKKGVAVVDSLQGQVAVVAGAASGIGLATCEVLAERGASVIMADIATERLASCAERVATHGATVLPLAVDVADPKSVESLVANARALGPVQILVNSVGVTGLLGKPAHEVPLEEFRRVIDINLTGAISLTQAFLPQMLAASYGRILHVASIAGKEGNPNMTPYDTSKAGLIGFVKGAAKEYAAMGVTINAIAPAVISGPMVDSQPPEVRDYLISRIPMGRVGLPREVAETVAFIVSPHCSFTTGFVFDASGGRATY